MTNNKDNTKMNNSKDNLYFNICTFCNDDVDKHDTETLVQCFLTNGGKDNE